MPADPASRGAGETMRWQFLSTLLAGVLVLAATFSVLILIALGLANLFANLFGQVDWFKAASEVCQGEVKP